MDGLNLDVKARIYLQSEAVFSRAKMKGALEVMMDRLRGCRQLLSFYDIADQISLQSAIDRGLHDIRLENIIGSMGRYHDFTRHFLPRNSDQGSRERWRTIYTLAVTGQGFPPIEVYKIDQVYFIRDGHHRASVAGVLGWPTIQAYVTELPAAPPLKHNCSGITF